MQAPELARDESHGAACDVWSLGALAHLLLSGQPPLHDGNTTRLQMKIGKVRKSTLKRTNPLRSLLLLLLFCTVG